MKRFVLIPFFCLLIIFSSYAQLTLKDVMQSGNKVCVITKCEDLPEYGEMIKASIAEETSWKIVRNPQDADFVLRVSSWSRPQVAGIVRDVYAIIELPDGSFMWRSEMKCGQPTGFNGYDYTKASIKKLIKEVLKRDASVVQDLKSQEIDQTGFNRVSDSEYQESQDYFFSACDFCESYKYNDALKAVEFSIQKNPYNAYAHRLQAIIYYKKSNYKKAIEAVQEAMKYDPYNADNDSLYLAAQLQKNDRFMRRFAVTLAVSSSLNTLSSAFANSINPGYSNQSSYEKSLGNEAASGTGNTTKPGVKKVTCSFCKGTGVSPTATSTASFANGGEEWCDVCHKWVYSGHGYHGSCPSCKGRGWNEKIALQ